jgi:signal transduction histidine kinase
MTENTNTLDQVTFNRLRRLYIIALGAIAVALVTSQILIRQYLADQEDDSRLVNVAGRQRMLNQKLNKEILLLSLAPTEISRRAIADTLYATKTTWEAAHHALQVGDEKLGIKPARSSEIARMFKEIQPSYERILTNTNALIQLAKEAPLDSATYQHAADEVLLNSPEFLSKMEQIVNKYDLEAKEKVENLKQLELILTLFTLLVLLAEFLIIFRPSAKAMKASIHELLEAEKKAIKMAKDADLLSQTKEKSVRELRALSQAMDQILLFARISPDGYITHMGDRFAKLVKFQKFNQNAKFSEVLSPLEKERLTLDRIIAENKKSGWQGEIKATTPSGQDLWLDFSMIPFHAGELSELIVICLDITKRKEAQLEVQQLTQESFEEKMLQQQVISRQIIENQENEQNRIAKDIHDGIGQMLTGLKYLLESVDLTDGEKAGVKLEKLKELTANIIKGVRTATFNLTPPELKDYGLVPALTELTQELSKLTGKEIILMNKSGFNQRLDSLMEINLYRITQEAINNAIKYAESTLILVTVTHSSKILSITIDDNGKGFDKKSIKLKPDKDGGMGLTFMQERIKYISGRLFINSSPERGTRVTLNVPLV